MPARLPAGHDVLLVLDGGGEEVEDELASLAGPHPLGIELAEVPHLPRHPQAPALQGHGRLPVGAPLLAPVVAPEDLETVGAVLAHQQALHLGVAGRRAVRAGHRLPVLQGGLHAQGDLLHQLRRRGGVVEDPEKQADPGPAAPGVHAQGEPPQAAVSGGQPPRGEHRHSLGSRLLHRNGIGHRPPAGALPAVAGDDAAHEPIRQAAALQVNRLEEVLRAAADPEAQDPRVDANPLAVGGGGESCRRRPRLHRRAVLQGEAAPAVLRPGREVEEEPAHAAVVPARQHPRLQGERLALGPHQAHAGRVGQAAPGEGHSPGRRVAFGRQAGRRVQPEGVPALGRRIDRGGRHGCEGDRPAGGVALPRQRLGAQGHVAEEQARVELPARRLRVGESVPAPHAEEELVPGQPFRRGHPVEDAQGQVELSPRRQLAEVDVDVAAGPLGVAHVALPDEAPVHEDLLEPVAGEVVGRSVGVGPPGPGLVPTPRRRTCPRRRG